MTKWLSYEDYTGCSLRGRGFTYKGFACASSGAIPSQWYKPTVDNSIAKIRECKIFYMIGILAWRKHDHTKEEVAYIAQDKEWHPISSLTFTPPLLGSSEEVLGVFRDPKNLSLHGDGHLERRVKDLWPNRERPSYIFVHLPHPWEVAWSKTFSPAAPQQTPERDPHAPSSL